MGAAKRLAVMRSWSWRIASLPNSLLSRSGTRDAAIDKLCIIESNTRLDSTLRVLSVIFVVYFLLSKLKLQRMVRPTPHSLSVFSLIPWNPRAEDVVDHLENQHFVSLVPGAESRNNDGGVPRGLNIGFHIGSRSRYTLATLGRSGDIFVGGSSIARV